MKKWIAMVLSLLMLTVFIPMRIHAAVADEQEQTDLAEEAVPALEETAEAPETVADSDPVAEPEAVQNPQPVAHPETLTRGTRSAGSYTLVTADTQLNDGDEIIFVGDYNGYYAMNNDFSGSEVTVTNNTISAPASTQSLRLTAVQGGWQLSDTNGYLCVVGSALSKTANAADAASITTLFSMEMTPVSGSRSAASGSKTALHVVKYFAETLGMEEKRP